MHKTSLRAHAAQTGATNGNILHTRRVQGILVLFIRVCDASEQGGTRIDRFGHFAGLTASHSRQTVPEPR
jgi:hypothetical protein